ncbi:NUDIX hydrolase, partial [Streptococcus pyogenes]
MHAAQLTPLFQCYLAPGYSSEFIHGFVARELEAATPQPQEDEIIAIEEYALDELLPMIGDARIRDAKTICGIL